MNLPFSNPSPAAGDPSAEYDARPIVALRRQDRSIWWFVGGLALAAVLLFSALEARRAATEQPQRPEAVGYAAPDAIPDYEAPSFAFSDVAPAGAPQPLPQPGDSQNRSSPLPTPQPVQPVQRANSGASYPSTAYYEPPPIPAASQDLPQPSSVERPTSYQAAGSQTDRILAGRLENPTTTVVQGTLINAVLETALDSTRPGQVRAVVTRDVHGFDGGRILIPRGTRLYGVYEADIALGQKRAQIRWTRLLRPDGVSVALDSPAADPLGRAGVEGKVDTHFFQRLGNALVGTTASVGSALVTRNLATSPVVVAVPAGQQAVQQAAPTNSGQIMPTLTVRQGTRVTVFVQHDLDFSSVEQAQ